MRLAFEAVGPAADSTHVPRKSAASGGNQSSDGLIVLKTATGLRFEPMAEVEWLESDANYVVFHIRGERLRVRMTMTELERVLDPAFFLRISRSILVNLAQAREAVSLGGGQYAFEMRGGRRLVSNRTRAKAIRSLGGSVRRW
jgi:DNA-binding LytR/AlgR family response regulator